MVVFAHTVLFAPVAALLALPDPAFADLMLTANQAVSLHDNEKRAVNGILLLTG